VLEEISEINILAAVSSFLLNKLFYTMEMYKEKKLYLKIETSK
jgi:hypothetical protein